MQRTAPRPPLMLGVRPLPSLRTSSHTKHTALRMRIRGIIWLENIVDKLERKHAVKQEEVKQILDNSPYFRLIEKGHRRGENVYSAMGQTEAGRYLIVFFVLKKDNRALILSARDMTDSERRRYDKK
jgi:uncharacterized DUF497 family protein